MRVIKPIAVVDSNFTSSTVAEPDSGVGEVEWSAGTYTLGTQRIESATHRVYEVVADPSTSDQPSVGVDANPPTWIDVKPTNRWAMFDNVNSTKTEDGTQIIVELTTDVITNSIAGFAIEGANAINVTVTDPIDGIVYNVDVDMNDNSEVADWYYYYFAPIIKRTEFALLDLPAYADATIKITIDGNDLKFGSLVVGNVIELGVANYGSSLELLDFSKKETDDFGNITVVEGRNSKLVNFDVTIPSDKTSYVFNTLSTLTTIPAVWLGTEQVDDATLVFGYYRNTQINISNPSISDATIQIEGLV